ncbi:hypothetical protein Bpro_5084 (plasmid) [Polaromonas sp. JS666]|nr:hypothetical protein Bpro_5084 [Polaromonas sp. JS666]
MVKLTREQLYRWVWSCPMTKIADELGISDSALSKKCREHDVPAPYRGYWRQVERGKQVQRVPLPDPDMGATEVPVNVSEARAAELDQLPAPVVNDKSYAGLALPKVLAGAKAPQVAAASGFASGMPRPQVGLAEEGRETMAAPADIIALATLHDKSVSARRFMEALREASQDCDAPTKAVLMLWTDAAGAFIFQSDPIARVIKECRRVASGNGNPGWWTSIQQGNGGHQ